MNQYRNFEYDNENFKGLPEFIKSLHDKGMHYVPIIDAALAYRDHGGYEAFNDGI